MEASMAKNRFRVDSDQEGLFEFCLRIWSVLCVKKARGGRLLKLLEQPVPFSFFQACYWSLYYRWHLTDLKETSARSPWYSANAASQQIKAGTRHFCEGKLLLHWQEVYGDAQNLPLHPTAHWLHLSSNLWYLSCMIQKLQRLQTFPEGNHYFVGVLFLCLKSNRNKPTKINTVLLSFEQLRNLSYSCPMEWN